MVGFLKKKITVEQALKAYIINSAYAGFQQDRLGQLKACYLADFVVLDKDILEISVTEIKQTQVLMTYVNGALVFQNKKDTK